MSHPIQDFETVDGVLRFKQNAIVVGLLAFAQEHGLHLSNIASLTFPDDDLRQFYQLLGHSLGGYGELVDREHHDAAYAMAIDGDDERDAKIAALTEELDNNRQAMKRILEMACEHTGRDES